MASFTTRVELHSAQWSDYENLHAYMAQQGFSRTIKMSIICRPRSTTFPAI